MRTPRPSSPPSQLHAQLSSRVKHKRFDRAEVRSYQRGTVEEEEEVEEEQAGGKKAFSCYCDISQRFGVSYTGNHGTYEVSGGAREPTAC